MKTTKDNEGAGSKVAGAVLSLGSIPVDAWAIKVMWWWFAVPLGVRGISAAHAFGLCCLIAVIRFKNRDVSSIDNRPLIERGLAAVTTQLIALGISAIAHWMMQP